MKAGSAKAVVPSAKDINEAHRLARSSAETAVQHAIRCGHLLAQKRAALKHGEFEKWVTQNCEFAESTARKYMKAANVSANQNATSVAFSTLQSLFPSSTKPKAEKRKPALPAPKEGPQPLKAAAQKPEPPKPVEVDPAPDFDFTDYEPEEDDAYRANVENVMMADDKLAAMREELKQCHREMQGLKASRDHYQSEAGTAVRLVKARDREIEKLKRELAKAKEENEALRERIAIMEQAA